MRTRLWPIALVVVGAIAAPLGCDPGEDTVAAEDLSSEERSARCDYFVRCGFAPDGGACQTAIGPNQQLVQALGGIAFGRVEYDAEAAAKWIEALSELTCDATIENRRMMMELENAVFKGQVERGKPCWAHAECSGDAVCDTTGCDMAQNECCTGSCVNYSELSSGTECVLNSMDPGTFVAPCVLETTYCAPPPDDGSGMPPITGTCTPRVDNGQPCTDADGCLDGQRCDVGGSDTCYKLSAEGGQCNPNLPNGSCLGINEVCDPGSSRCVTAPSGGAPCVQGRCQPFSICMMDVCVDRLREFEPCDGSISCLGDLQCRDNVCQREEAVTICVAGQPPIAPP